MRLRACVAFELVVGLGLIAGLGVSVRWGVGEAREYFSRPAQAAVHSAPTEPTPGGTIRPLERGTDFDPSASALPLFHGVSDEVLMRPIRSGAIKSIKFNRGGSSISLRIDFDNGARAAFKPNQTNPQTVPRREIAAYRLNRLVGLNTVPPAIGRSFAARDIYKNIRAKSRSFIPRMRAEIVPSPDGRIAGELSWWIPVIAEAYIGGHRIDTTPGILNWMRHLRAGSPTPDRHYDLVRQLSAMLVFDFFVNNVDRWSGANARTSADGRYLYYMDNTLSFGPEMEGNRKSRVYLSRTQKFSRKLIRRLRALTARSVREILAPDRGPFPYLLSRIELDAVMSRRDYLIRYVDGLIARHGYDAVMVFP